MVKHGEINNFSIVTSTCPKTMFPIKLCQKQLSRNLASVKLKLEKLNRLLRVQPNFFVLAFLTLEVLSKLLSF